MVDLLVSYGNIFAELLETIIGVEVGGYLPLLFICIKLESNLHFIYCYCLFSMEHILYAHAEFLYAVEVVRFHMCSRKGIEGRSGSICRVSSVSKFVVVLSMGA